MEFEGSTQPTAGSPPGLPPSAPPRLIRLVEDLVQRADLSGERLASRLRRALSLHDLNRQELLAAQRDVVRLQRIGALPPANEYWQRTALPRAARLVDASMTAVVEEGHQLGEAIDHFLLAVDEPPEPQRPAGPDSAGDQPGEEFELDRVSSEIAERAIGRLLAAVPSSQSIDALGSWWQRRLRRAAVLGSFPRLLITGDAERLIGQTEMGLLDRPPWSHGDRLLSAFELAHGEIRTQTELVAEGLAARITTRGRPYLAPAERVTIELRN